VVLGPELEDSRVVRGRGREESKSQLEGVLGFFFFFCLFVFFPFL
jgi:hypothetical protein